MRPKISSCLLCVLPLVWVAGCSSGPENAAGSGSAKVDVVSAADLSVLEDDEAQRYREARRAQETALADTSDVVARADEASVEELESAMSTLNAALLRAHAVVVYLRNHKIRGKKSIIAEISGGNARVRTAFNALLVHHPHPTAGMLDMGGN
ncbi:MAG: hypothetical protein ACE5IK_04765 [Acidobacteriota bacterium]